MKSVPREWKDIHKGKRCFVMGNGPSLLKQDLGLLKDEVTIGVNGICRKFIPSYLAICDGKWAAMRQTELVRVLQSHPEMAAVFCSHCTAMPAKYPRVKWANRPFMDGPKAFIDPDLWKACNGHTVTLDLAVPFAAYLGCNPIYLVGCDCGDTGHFYSPGVKSTYTLWNPWSTIMKCYASAARILGKRDVKLYNATEGGSLNSIPRVKYEDIFTPEGATPIITGVAAHRNLHRGKRCFILGNGPSLDLMDLSVLKDEVTFTCNNIFAKDLGWKPTYYTCVDGRHSKLYRKQMNAFEAKYKFYAQKYAHLLAGGPKTLSLNAGPEVRFCKDITNEVQVGNSVLFVMLQMAFFAGCDPVYIIGADCQAGHFEGYYQDVPFKPANIDWHPLFQGFKVMQRAYKSSGRRLYNAGVGGALKVLPRVDLIGLFVG